MRDDEGPILGYSSVIGSADFTAEILFLPRIDGACFPCLTHTGLKYHESGWVYWPASFTNSRPFL